MKKKTFLLCAFALATLVAGTLTPVNIWAEEGNEPAAVQVPTEIATTEIPVDSTSTTISSTDSDSDQLPTSTTTVSEEPVSTTTSTLPASSSSDQPTPTSQTESVEGLLPIYRLYNPRNGEHLYTTDANEKNVLYSRHGWGYEGIGWYSPSSGTPVYRLYNAGLQNHLYTTDTNEVKVLTSRHGWKSDNNGRPVFYSDGTIAIYRVYNPKLRGLHHWTTDRNEYNVLPKHGWKQEGIKFYGVKMGEPIRTQFATPPAPKPAPKVVAPAPRTNPTPPVVQQPAQSYYPNCAAVRAAGRAPLHRGEPGYRPGLDRDGDGIACDR